VKREEEGEGERIGGGKVLRRGERTREIGGGGRMRQYISMAL
jgi:hypothetical protein